MKKQSKELRAIKAKLKRRISSYKNTGVAELLSYEASIEAFARMDELEYLLDWLDRKLAQEVKELK